MQGASVRDIVCLAALMGGQIALISVALRLRTLRLGTLESSYQVLPAGCIQTNQQSQFLGTR